MASPSPSRAVQPRPPRRRWAPGSPTSSARTPAPSASSGRTRPPPTDCRPCSTSPTASSSATSSKAEHVAQPGRGREVLCEHLCQGFLEGYLLTGRHGLFNCYEAFIHIIDAMFNQHAKWLET